MADRNVKSEYLALTEYYIKFLSIRGLIILSIVLSLYSSVKSINDDGIKQQVKKIDDIARKTLHKPVDDDYIVNHLFFNSFYYYDHDDSVCCNRMDSVARDSLIAVQRSLVTDLRLLLKKKFELKVSAFGDVTFDMMYWILILPVIVTFTSIYITILDTKITVLKSLAILPDNSGSSVTDERKIDSYTRFPFEFLKLLFFIGECVLGVMFAYCFFGFIDKIATDNVYPILSSYIILFYFGMVYAVDTSNTILQESSITGEARKPLFLRVWDRFVGVVGIIVSKIPLRVSSWTSFILITATLFLVMTMSLGGCDMHTYKGYEMITSYHKAKWLSNESEIIGAVFMHVGYIVALLFTWYFSLRYFLFKGKELSLFMGKTLIIFPGLLLILFMTYWGVLTPDVSWFLLPFFILSVSWLSVNKIFFTDKRINFTLSLKTLFTVVFPFALFALRPMYMGAIFLPGWVAFYIGLFFLVISCYKFVQDKMKGPGSG